MWKIFGCFILDGNLFLYVYKFVLCEYCELLITAKCSIACSCVCDVVLLIKICS